MESHVSEAYVNPMEERVFLEGALFEEVGE